MDGNRRWAKKHHLSILIGHRKAAYNTIEPLVDKAIEKEIPYLTLWAFSTENWKRNKQEVEGLLLLFRETLAENIEKLHKKGVRIQSIGDLSKFPKDIQEKIHNGIEKTKNNNNLTLVFALNYGGRDEIVRTINILFKKIKNQKSKIKIREQYVTDGLDTVGIPDPDLIVRTGGEMRLSGFLPWQSVYSELYFTEVLFPDFSPDEFEKALLEYSRRKRRFGK
jgi:undecaprenyl diphosphate synthase